MAAAHLTVSTRAPTTTTNWQIVALMALGFGLVGIDRFMISTLFPVIAKDLLLDYSDIGLITGALAFAWGLAALVMGNMSDRIGRRKVLAGSLLAFALLIGASGLATGLAGLIFVRVIMGLADGTYTPASIAATIEASAARHHGLAIGVQQMMLPVFGVGIAPLVIAGLLHVVDWRWTFVLFSAPGLLLSWLVWKRMTQDNVPAAMSTDSVADWRAVLAFRNIRIAMALMLCWLTCLVTTSALLPSYLIDHVHLGFGAMSGVMSAIGLGSAAGTICLSALSDKIGRKPVLLIGSAGAMLSLVLLANASPIPMLLFALLFTVHFCNNAAITMTVGPLCVETVPVALMATASGAVIATGEVFGGGFAPVIAGQIAKHFGIDFLLWLPIGSLAAGFVLSLFLIETRPRRSNAQA